MTALAMLITTAGLNALVDAQAGTTAAIEITEIGLTQTEFVMAPTLTAIPGEIKRVGSVSGLAISDNVIHMTASDTSVDAYTLTGFGLYLASGTLFAVYSQALPIFTKASVATFLLSVDIAFADNVGGDIVFGDALFANPPASETVMGIARVATQAEITAAVVDNKIVTPKTLGVRLAAFIASVNAQFTALSNAVTATLDGFAATIAALAANTVGAGGVASGGGAINTNPVITVTAATLAQLRAGTSTNTVITPEILSAVTRSLTPNGSFELPGGQGLMLQWQIVTSALTSGESTAFVSFPISFSTMVFPPVVSTQIPSGNTGSDFFYQTVGDPTLSGVTIQRQKSGAVSDSLTSNCIIWSLGK